MSRVLVAAVIVCVFNGFAAAQPRVVTLTQPQPNPAGWINSPALVRYICEDLANCPARQEIATEGAGQVIVSTASDAQGLETRSEVTINLDRTPPDVAIQSPSNASVTTALSVRVSARAADALSGLGTAMCNGQPAQIKPTGEIDCVVLLAPGANDIIVDVSDLAGNSGSAWVRITRAGKPTRLRILPDELSVLVGRPRTLQVVDEFGNDVPDVSWRVDNFRVLQISTDGRHVVTPMAPGVVTVTAIHGGVSVDARISVYAGGRFPAGAVTWRVSSLSMVQTPDGPPQALPDASQKYRRYVMQPKMKPPQLLEIGERDGRVAWMSTPAVSADEQVLTMMTHQPGGAVMVVESNDALRSSLVRAGPAATGSLWRYRSPGRLSDKLVQDINGTLLVVETAFDGFPRIVVIDGLTGRVRNYLQLNPGLSVVLNVGCVRRAHAARDVPPEMGPATILADGSVTFEMVQASDLEDFGQCGSVSGYFRRNLQVVTTAAANGPSVELIGQYEVVPTSPAPVVKMFQITDDGHGGRLVPWTVQYADTPPESHVARLTTDGRQDFPLPAASDIVKLSADLGAMIDGKTLVVFDLVTGEKKWARVFPKGGARILPAPPGTLIVVHPQGTEMLDETGRLVQRRP